MGSEEGRATHCIGCGARLDPEHRFCWSCGAERWSPPAPAGGGGATPEAAVPVPGLPWFYAAGAVLWLLLLAQTAGILAAAPVRRELLDQLARAGYTGRDAVTMAGVEGAIMLLLPLGVAAVHGVAFYGLRARRRWGWVAAVLVAGAWSLAVVGIPVLVLLLRPATRSAYRVR